MPAVGRLWRSDHDDYEDDATIKSLVQIKIMSSKTLSMCFVKTLLNLRIGVQIIVKLNVKTGTIMCMNSLSKPLYINRSYTTKSQNFSGNFSQCREGCW